MPLFLIAGSAGSGKTTVCHALKERGYAAYDTDNDGFAKWQHNETGYVHPKSSVKPHQRTDEFIHNHSWNVPREEVQALADSSGDAPVFLCGEMGNEDALRDLFDEVFALYVDDDTLKQRLAGREGNHWGKQPHELAQTLEWHRLKFEKHQKLGSVIIDASRPVDTIVKDILAEADVS